MEPPPKKCPKCNDTKWYQYSGFNGGTPHCKTCEVCCTHEGTPFPDPNGTDKFFCRVGCGTEMPPPTKKDCCPQCRAVNMKTLQYFCGARGCDCHRSSDARKCGKTHYYQEGFITCECGQGSQLTAPKDAMEGDYQDKRNWFITEIAKTFQKYFGKDSRPCSDCGGSSWIVCEKNMREMYALAMDKTHEYDTALIRSRFISKAALKGKMGMFRQWLNEKPSEHLVTNADIDFWLGL
jgi:hypothetical protein